MTEKNGKVIKLTRMVEKPHILDPKSDIVFKKIFGEHPDLVKSFLNSVLPLPADRIIESIEYLSPEQSPRIPSMKNTIVDVKCKDQDGRVFITEMQMLWHSGFDKRLLHGASRAVSQQLERGGDYSDLCPVYGLAILNEVFEPDLEEWYHHYRLIHALHREKCLEGLELIFVELPKFKPQTFKDRKLGALWLRFLKEINIGSDAVPEEFLENPDLAQAVQLAQQCSYTKEELLAYDYYLDAVRVDRTARNSALKAGMEIGSENRAKLVANKMIKKGFMDKEISDMTELNLEIILNLREEASKE